MLQAATAGIEHHGAKTADPHVAVADSANVELGHVLSDALATGSHGKPDIDSLLQAFGGSHGHGPLAELLGGAHEAYASIHPNVMAPLIDAMVMHEVAPPHA